MLLLWMAVQLLALSLAAGRVPLSARFPHPIERQATAQMLIVQVVASTLFFPVLLRNWRGLGFAIAGAWPMLALAALLGNEPVLSVASAAIYVAVWLTTLRALTLCSPTEQWRQNVVAILGLWTIGGPILVYLRSEYGGASGLWPPEASSIAYAAAGGPVWAVLARLWSSRLIFVSDTPLGMLLVLAALINAKRFFCARRFVNKLSTGL
jgi:hypothetical protein